MEKTNSSGLPQAAVDYIDSVIKAMKYRKKVRAEVRDELTAHFADALATCADEQDKLRRTEELIEQFGDAKLLAVLIRRGKKRCRPLWKTILVRLFQTACVLFSLLALYVGWFLSGKPIITTNYLEVMNQQVRSAADDSQNAWPLYQQAAEKYVAQEDTEFGKDLCSLAELSDAEREVILQLIKDNQESLNLIRQGNQKSYYWQVYGVSENINTELISVPMPHLVGYKKIAQLTCWQALMDAEQGNMQKAFDNTLEIYSFGQHLRGQNTTLIEQLVAMGIEGISMGTLRILLDENTQGIDAPLLASVQKRFDAMVSKENFTVSYEGEKLCLYDEIQRSFTQSRIGASHVYIQRWFSRFGMPTRGDGLETLTEWLCLLFTQPNRDQTCKTADHFYAEMGRLSAMTPASLRKEGIDMDERVGQIVQSNIFLGMLSPRIRQISHISHCSRAGSTATLTLFSILQYRKAHNAYPDSLEALVQAGLQDEVPMDPFSDKPLVYRKTDDGFTLYSVGFNFVDDGGAPGTDKDGKLRQWGDNGDAVFWPVKAGDF